MNIGNPIPGWITVEPLGSLFVLISAALLFAHFFSRAGGSTDRFTGWLIRIFSALVRSLLFIGIWLSFSLLLRSSYQAFLSIYGPYSRYQSLSWAAWQKAIRDRAPVVQQELEVRFYTQTTAVEELPRSDKSQPVLYHNVIQRQEVLQNGITAFNGKVDLQIPGDTPPTNGTSYFNTFLVTAHLEYQVENNIANPVEADFMFPLGQLPHYPQEVLIEVDGQDVSHIARVEDHGVAWTMPMGPGERKQVTVDYAADGEGGYSYVIPDPREIRAFVFEISVNSLHIFVLNSPDILTFESKSVDQKSIFTWKLDHEILSPSIGLFFIQGEEYAPYDRVLLVMETAGRALPFLIAIFTLTLLILGQKVALSDVVLLACFYSLPFSLTMGMNKLSHLPWIVFPVGVLFTLVLSFLTFLKFPRLPFLLILIWIFLFTGTYPFSGWITDSALKNSFNTAVPVGMIVYMFGLGLYARIRSLRNKR